MFILVKKISIDFLVTDLVIHEPAVRLAENHKVLVTISSGVSLGERI